MKESTVDPTDLARAVARLLSRCTRLDGGHLTLGLEQPQLRVRRVTVSARRAVFAVHHGRLADPARDVVSSCGVNGCLSGEHLVEMAPGEASFSAFASKTREAQTLAGRRKRKYTDEQERRLRDLVQRGTPITYAAEELGVGAAWAAHVIQGRRGAGGNRYVHRGTRKNPQCTRCGELGHYRNRGCPLASGKRRERA